MYDFTNGLQATAERVDALVASARKGNTAALVAVKAMTKDALCFAIYAANTPIARQEQHFADYANDRVVMGTGVQKQAHRSADAWLETHFSLELFDDKTGHTFAEKADLCRGLGPAKATYAGALLGFTHCPCYDRWMQRYCQVPEMTHTKWPAYYAQQDASGMYLTTDQWDAFRGVDNYTGHGIYFDRILAGVNPA